MKINNEHPDLETPEFKEIFKTLSPDAQQSMCVLIEEGTAPLMAAKVAKTAMQENNVKTPKFPPP